MTAAAPGAPRKVGRRLGDAWAAAEHDAHPGLDPMIGQRIRGYVVRHKLAEGGMGAVYLATHERLENTRKVIKILLPVYARHPMLRERFEREALAVSRLRHNHIVTIDDYGQLPDGQLFFMMPFLEGRPLDAHLAEHGPLAAHRALHILVQVCSALQHMHDAGIVHRDIKPGNLFIVQDDDNPYRVVLLDLGIAKSLSDRDLVTHAGTTMGTPPYMAVEQHEDAASVTPSADLYAVAIVAWEMIAGAMPWGTPATSSELLYIMKQRERPARPPGMSAEWYATLLGALSVHPADRPPSMRALATALASSVPAIPPDLPSGAEILAQLAKPFVQHAPPTPDALPPLDAHAAAARRGRPPAPAVTPIARPAGRRERPPTTPLEKSAEHAVTPAAPRPRGTAIALALGGFAVAAAAAFALTRGKPRDASPAGAPSQAITAGPPPAGASAPADAGASPDAARLDRTEAAIAVDAGAPAVLQPRTEPPRPLTRRVLPPMTAPEPATKATGDRRPDASGNGARFDPNAVGGGDT